VSQPKTSDGACALGGANGVDKTIAGAIAVIYGLAPSCVNQKIKFHTLFPGSTVSFCMNIIAMAKLELGA